MPLSNRNNSCEPHNDTIFHERAQQIINGERDNSSYDPNTRANTKWNNGIGTITNIGIIINRSTNSISSYNTARVDTNSVLNTDNTSDNTNNNNKINKDSDSTNADTNPTSNDNNLTNNTNSNENNSNNINTSNTIFRNFSNSNGVIVGTAEKYLQNIRVAGPPARGHLPSRDGMNLDNNVGLNNCAQNNTIHNSIWNANTNNNVIQRIMWALNPISSVLG